MDNLTCGNPRAHAIRVYFENSGSATIYEGMPLCYNWDTTTNWFGGSVSDGAVTASTTTLEATANESRYIRVELPDAGNIHAFAGVVKKGGWCGKSDARVVDIYVPNGAIVPVRAGVATTVGRTVLSVISSVQYLGHALSGSAARPVAVAMATNAALSTAGLVLAKLDDNMFLYQTNQAATLYSGVGATAASASQCLNIIDVESAHTGGFFSNFIVKSTLSGALAAAGGGASIIGYINQSGNITTGCYVRPILGQLNLGGGTINSGSAQLCGVMAQLSGAATITACSHVAALWCDSQIGDASEPTAGELSMARFSNNGDATLTQFLHFYGNTAITPGKGGVKFFMSLDICQAAADELNACVIGGGTGDTTITTGATWKKIRIEIDGTQYWLIACSDPAES